MTSRSSIIAAETSAVHRESLPGAVQPRFVLLRLARNGGIPDTFEHPNEERYPGQRIHVIEIEGYAWLVPFVESDDEVFLETMIPSRKATRTYLGDPK